MRLERGWSQEELAQRSGLSVRTVQRIENGQPPGLASARALADVFGVEVAEVTEGGASADGTPEAEPAAARQPFATAVTTCLTRYADFEGRASRSEYWWFALFVGLLTAAIAQVSESLGGVILVLALLPLTAAGARRLHDTGHSGWWQLFALAPVGFVVPLVLLVLPSAEPAPEPAAGVS